MGMPELALYTPPTFCEDRTQFIGASEIAAVMGLSPYATPVDVWLRKTGQDLPFEDTPATILGHVLEHHLLAYACKVLGLTNEFSAQQPFKEGNVAAHIDYFSPENGIIECKTTSYWLKKDWGDELTDNVPSQVQVQVQAQMHLSGAKVAYVPVLLFRDDGVRQGMYATLSAIGNTLSGAALSETSEKIISGVLENLLIMEQAEFRLYKVSYNQGAAKYSVDFAHNWYEKHVINGVEPDPTNTEDCKALYAFKHVGVVDAKPSDVKLLKQFIDLTDQIAGASARLRELEKARKELKVDLEATLGHFSEMWCDELGGKLVRNSVNRKPTKGCIYTTLKWSDKK